MYPFMENHDFALQMQNDYINDIETRNPKYLLFVDIPSSWSRRRNSHDTVFQWISKYQAENYRLTGIIELTFEGKTNYNWRPGVDAYNWEAHSKWPVVSQFSVAIFERKATSELF